jgi:hypothetical protein
MAKAGTSGMQHKTTDQADDRRRVIDIATGHEAGKRKGRYDHLTMTEFVEDRVKKGFTVHRMHLYKESFTRSQAHKSQDVAMMLSDLLKAGEQPFISYVAMEPNGATRNFGGGFVKKVFFRSNSSDERFSRPGDPLDGMEPEYWVLQCAGGSKEARRMPTFSVRFGKLHTVLLKPSGAATTKPSTKRAASALPTGEDFKVHKTSDGGVSILANGKVIKLSTRA